VSGKPAQGFFWLVVGHRSLVVGKELKAESDYEFKFIHEVMRRAIMEVDETTQLEVELKYCERCGALWLRPRGSEEVYCAACVPKMAEFPAPRPLRCGPRLPVAPQVESDIEGCLAELAGVCGEGGKV
jgi:hypothetical protein